MPPMKGRETSVTLSPQGGNEAVCGKREARHWLWEENELSSGPVDCMVSMGFPGVEVPELEDVILKPWREVEERVSRTVCAQSHLERVQECFEEDGGERLGTGTVPVKEAFTCGTRAVIMDVTW